MKLLRVNSSKIMIFLFINFFVFGVVKNGFSTIVEIAQGQLLVDGKSFIVKGVDYSPVPIGIDPWIRVRSFFGILV